MPATGLSQPGAGMMQQERMSIVDPDKKLSAGDQVTVEILEDREGGLPRVVTATGELDVPPLGRVKVSGRTAAEAASEIKQQLEHDYYYHATVRLAIDRVSPVSVRSGLVYLSGEVRVGGPQEIISGETLTLTNAILKAGGVGEWGTPRKSSSRDKRREAAWMSPSPITVRLSNRAMPVSTQSCKTATASSSRRSFSAGNNINRHGLRQSASSAGPNVCRPRPQGLPVSIAHPPALVGAGSYHRSGPSLRRIRALFQASVVRILQPAHHS
ncbi:MAG: polysaccharide biosynthesis/export family protein [Chthoniobacter sp.]